MSMQLFSKLVPIEHVFDILEKICLKTDKYYLFDANAFKVMVFKNYFADFRKLVRPYYNLSKRFYIDRELTYNSFTNVLRQICKSNKVMFTSQTKYNESKYGIDFMIYY